MKLKLGHRYRVKNTHPERAGQVGRLVDLNGCDGLYPDNAPVLEFSRVERKGRPDRPMVDAAHIELKHLTAA